MFGGKCFNPVLGAMMFILCILRTNCNIIENNGNKFEAISDISFIENGNGHLPSAAKDMKTLR